MNWDFDNATPLAKEYFSYVNKIDGIDVNDYTESDYEHMTLAKDIYEIYTLYGFDVSLADGDYYFELIGEMGEGKVFMLQEGFR